MNANTCTCRGWATAPEQWSRRYGRRIGNVLWQVWARTSVKIPPELHHPQCTHLELPVIQKIKKD